jgi:ATP-dependent Lon protease
MGERVEATALARSVTTEFESYVKLNKKVPPEAVGVVQQIEDYAQLADTVASHLVVKIPDKEMILETPSVTERLEKVLGLIDSEIHVQTKFPAPLKSTALSAAPGMRLLSIASQRMEIGTKPIPFLC